MAKQLSAENLSITEKDVIASILADNVSLRTQLAAAVVDITALRAAVVGITAKLDADAGVTDTNYASTLDPAAQTSAAPDAATIVA